MTIFESQNKIEIILPNGEDKIYNESEGIYQISCDNHDKIYIDQKIVKFYNES